MSQEDGDNDNLYIGRYATGVIVGRYRAGGLLDVSVEVTANHGGQRD